MRSLRERVVESIALAADPVLYARERMNANPIGYQEQIMRDRNQYIGIVCARQVGKTWTVGMKSGHFAASTPNGLGLIFAPSEQQAVNLLNAARPYIRQSGVEIVDDLKKEIVFSNGAELRALPGSTKTIRGWSGPGLLIIDEAAFSDNDLWYAVEPMIAGSGGQVIALSSADATYGFFYDAMTGDDPHWSRYKVTAYEWLRVNLPADIAAKTGYDREWLEWKRNTLPERIFKREYLAEFVDPVGTLISADVAKRAEQEMDDLFDSSGRSEDHVMDDLAI